jgi:hypothetical protein
MIPLPPKDNTPLIVDPDRMKASQIATQPLEPITWRNPQIA